MKSPSIAFIACFLLMCNAAGIEAKTREIEMLSWNEVNSLLPRYSTFTVEDFETGAKFRVQRRAGGRHADVQPVTAKDTKIMKRIYNGKWSWKRRAIIVRSKNFAIAASMHGMPHGAGALKNNFPGHFCIHFYGSTTHRSSKMDLSHQLMILKSAGKLEKFLEEADVSELVDAYFAGIKQQDPHIVSLISAQQLNWKKALPLVENIRPGKLDPSSFEDAGASLVLNVPVEVNMQLKGTGRANFEGELMLIRFSPAEQWQVNSVKFFEEAVLSKKQEKKA
ncbi:hypothetical protein [Bacillus sp. T33-2]|uniref:hypothetical protein n=1 Tax=Bacillus sp. T33-2 TaxID=2054168 RepID=UPI000C77117C|nr:hypothetical protein [Bacillus sp. T33-2]PLR98860.1 hypothetical protein CVD19_04295 [Bacillus sp. T33-2]